MPPQNSIVFELVHHHINTLFRAGASDFVTAVSAWWTIENWDIASKITPCGGGTFCPKVVGHFVPRWWDNPKSSYYMHAMQKRPLYIYFLYIDFLNGAAQSPRPSPPGYAAVRRRKDLATLGLPGEPLPRGSPGPPPPVRPQRALAQGLRPRFARLSAPKG